MPNSEQTVTPEFHRAALAEIDARAERMQREIKTLAEASEIVRRSARDTEKLYGAANFKRLFGASAAELAAATDLPAPAKADDEKWRQFTELAKRDPVKADAFRVKHLARPTSG